MNNYNIWRNDWRKRRREEHLSKLELPKFCPSCKTTKQYKDFYATMDCRCKECSNHKEVMRHKDKGQYTDISYRYNLNKEQYDKLVSRYNGLCAICNKVDPRQRRLCIDHDHSCCNNGRKSCGKCVRGLLCTQCNHMLGMIESRDIQLESISNYLKNFKKQNRN